MWSCVLQKMTGKKWAESLDTEEVTEVCMSNRCGLIGVADFFACPV